MVTLVTLVTHMQESLVAIMLPWQPHYSLPYLRQWVTFLQTTLSTFRSFVRMRFSGISLVIAPWRVFE